MAEMINRDAPLSGLSSLMAMKGRQGDTELIHMTKPEIAGLASLGKLTINPDTGLPEAFSFKQILPALAGLASRTSVYCCCGSIKAHYGSFSSCSGWCNISGC
jgi:hypothetical protein